ncbi:MAG: hypothetical protein ACT4QC_05170 [Planctomycetaceae bacterium]
MPGEILRCQLAHVAPLLGLICASAASAQMLGSGGGGLILRAAHPAVILELGLDDATAEKVVGLAAEFDQELQTQAEKSGFGPSAFEGLQGLGEDDRTKKLGEIRGKTMELGRKLDRKYAPRLKEIISAEQFTRVQQIRWQVGGSQTFDDPEIVTALVLTKDQQERIAAINKDSIQKQSALFAAGFAGPNAKVAEMVAKLQELNAERDAKALEVLTEAQRKKLAELKGKPFDLRKFAPPGPGASK